MGKDRDGAGQGAFLVLQGRKKENTFVKSQLCVKRCLDASFH